ncbi:major facilitator superfamily domain-containing protein [Microdochium trichocladiopsis]|uniref:Major facilitator superfamily domain-containing protein n=1 Tax=Microdochium trichocladiopsis TaxID=1682393 RepID=A0A9P9BLW9_9PEZI|nr:major facilitator superfamily domain-containing protein [Microdochium trichocladiopsis]KAH7025678.1 major facilitator superfamily domain-containing protein [Microdochium trichocladiopsis]
MAKSSKEAVVIHDQTNLLTGSKLIIVFCALASALLITYIDQNSIGVALPTIGRELNSASTIVWAGTSSLIANTAFQVLYGRLSDILGRKVILITCLCMLGLADLLCGFAQSGPQLYAFRGISGLANGGIMALVMMVVSDITTLEQRGKYQGILGSCVGLGNTIGPFLAAAFTTHVTWRATFWLITPLTLCVAVLLYFLLPPQTIPPEPLSTKLAKIDWIGGITSSIGTILLLIPISGLGTQFSTSSPMVIAMITLGAFFLLLFVLHEYRFAKLPMLPLRLFNNPALAAMLTQNFLIGIVFQSLLYYLPIYFQSALRMNLVTSAALILPTVIPQAVASALSGQYISRMKRYGEVIWLGYICWTIGSSLHCIFDRSTAIVAMVFILGVEGWGIGCVFQPTLVAAQAHSPKQDRAVVIAARNFIRALGGSAGLAISSAIYSNALIGTLSGAPDIPQSFVDKVRHSVFEVPDLDGLGEAQQNVVLNSYVFAARSIFYLWAGAMAICLMLMLFIKDKGLTRQEEQKPLSESATSTDAAVGAAVVEGDGKDKGSAV